jgi:hypothetical protein
VVMFDPLPGHGEDNSRHMERAGTVTWAATRRELCALLGSPEFWEATAPATAGAARSLFNRPCTAECLDDLRPVAGPTRALVRARRVAVVTAAVMALGVADRAADAVAAPAPHAHTPPVVRTWAGR